MLSPAFRIRVENLPPGEWYKLSTRDTFCEAAETLLGRGMTEDEAYDFLANMYSAVSEEYGC